MEAPGWWGSGDPCPEPLPLLCLAKSSCPLWLWPSPCSPSPSVVWSPRQWHSGSRLTDERTEPTVSKGPLVCFPSRLWQAGTLSSLPMCHRAGHWVSSKPQYTEWLLTKCFLCVCCGGVSGGGGVWHYHVSWNQYNPVGWPLWWQTKFWILALSPTLTFVRFQVSRGFITCEMGLPHRSMMNN